MEQTDLQTRGDLKVDGRAFGAHWAALKWKLSLLPAKPERSPSEQEEAARLQGLARDAREHFLRAHAETLYDQLTGGGARFVRLQDLVFAAAEAVPGLCPSRAEIAAETGRLQKDKDGLEIDQGLFLSHVLASQRCGSHLCHAMLTPRPETAEALARFAVEGRLDLGAAVVERRGRAAWLTARNPRYLNAEDAATLDAMEIAVDVAILDPATQIVVLQGGPVEHPKYRGRNILGSGINLTHLYRGLIPFTWYLQRDLGYVHKIFRGVAREGALPDDIQGRGTEKPWVAALETFAIGGHCQLLLVMDYVLAGRDAFMTLPARKEGIIPGFANLRLPRFVGDRIARQAVQYERRLDCDSAEGRMICDELVDPVDMAEGLARVAEGLTSSGTVSAVGNRRAFRVGQEPFDLFRRYAAVYAREQAFCHFSPALISNLERYWGAQNRTL